MWTPRRIMLVVVGVVFFGTAYGVYAYFLGWVDGLPSLPEALALKAPYDPTTMTAIRPDGNPTAQRIRQAFGPNAPELRYWIKADSKAKGILLVAHEMSKPDEQGRITLTPCSVAIFGKTRGAKGVQEITTMHCDRAIIQTDVPVQKYSDMEGRKIIAAELHADPDIPHYHPYKGKIRITNNRKSDDPDDQIEIKTPGPVYYKAEPEAGMPQVWTENVLEVMDRANLPRGEQDEDVARLPTLTAQGMKLFLLHEEKPEPKDAPPKKDKKPANPAAVSGVERIELLSNVTMNLWLDPGSSFMATSTPPKPQLEAKDPKKVEDPKKTERSMIQIRTYGPFFYNMAADKARFEHASLVDPSIPNYVQVTRQMKGSPNRDMLTSDFLEIQFLRKKPIAKTATPAPKSATPPAATAPAPKTAAPAPKTDKTDKPASEGEMDIDTIHAWGGTVVISSDSEEVTAYGNDLLHDNVNKQTNLRGEKIIVVKEGNQITAKELIIAGMDNRNTQQAKIRGPGQIDIGQVDPVTKEFVYVKQAQWQDWLVYGRVKEQGRELDVLTLTGGAKFADKQTDQFIAARQLKLWIIPAKTELPKEKEKDREKSAKVELPVKKEATKEAPPKSKPHRLEATSEVIAHGPEIDVRNADYLNVWFKESTQVIKAEPLSAVVVKNPMGVNPPMPMTIPIPTLVGPMPMVATMPMAKDPPKVEPKKKPPIKISAKRIESWMVTTGARNDLDHVHCEERVVVHQDGTEESPGGIDLSGKTLDVEKHPDGNLLVVTGTKEDFAEVKYDKIDMFGEDIVINQRNNTATIKGPGTLRMESNTNLRGEKLGQAKPMIIHWQDGMEFRGADQAMLFDGKVQATQENSRVLCESMQVILDRVVWLNHLEKPKDPKEKKEDSTPKVDRVICDQQPKQIEPGTNPQLNPVIMIEEIREKGKLIKYQYLESKEFDLDNLKRKLASPGPGIVRIFQPGPKEGVNEQPVQGQKIEMEMKLIYVEYSRQMQAQTNTNPQWAKFFGPTEAFHLPATDPDMKFNRAKLPERAVRLKCKDELVVTTRKEKGPDGNELTYQTLEAQGNVEVWSDDFKADANIVKYDQKRDTITFEGDRNLPAVISKTEVRGRPAKNFEGGKIIYNRKTKEFKGEDGRSFEN